MKLISTGVYTSPAVHGQGWWKTESRFFNNKIKIQNTGNLITNTQPIVIIGKSGTLGKAFSQICHQRLLNHVLLSREDIDICSYKDIESIIHKYNPWAIVNAAGYVRVDEAENDSLTCFRENAIGPEQLALACRKYGLQLMTFSSDLVFDGMKNAPYVESDAVNPLNVYGASKAQAESAVLGILPQALVIRTSAFFGPWDKHNFVHGVLASIQNGINFRASKNVISPTYVPHLVNTALDLLIDNAHGIWHLTNNDPVSWYDLAQQIADRANLNKHHIVYDNNSLPAKRPQYSVLKSEKSILMPNLETALNAYFSHTLTVA